MSRKLLLFDIDGTLLTANGLGSRLFQEVLTRICGREISTRGVCFSGKTDPQIIREVLSGAGFDPPEAERIGARALHAYAAHARQAISPEVITVLPGVRALLETLPGSFNVQLALLTGNMEETAYMKVRAAGLGAYFPFGAFGSDHPDRDQLPAIAARRAFRHGGRRFEGRDMVVVGDSPRDVRCGRAAGARTIAVATGVTDAGTLAREEPDVLLRDLTDVRAFHTGARLTRQAVAVNEP